LRLEQEEIFQKGHYIPLTVKGRFKDEVIAFAREYHDHYILLVAPRFSAGMVPADIFPVGKSWKDTSIILPESENSEWRNAITGANIKAADSVKVSEVLKHFPIGVLTV